MKLKSSSRILTRRRAAAALATFALPIGMLATTAAPAEAYAAPDSPFEVFIDTTASSDPADSIQNGFWGHEGAPNNGTGTGTSYLDADGADPDFFSTFPSGELGNIRVVFVPAANTSSPNATAGQTVDQVFGSTARFADVGLQTGLAGDNIPNDSVLTVSTGAEFDAWYSAGQPLQGYNNNLQLTDVSAPGNPVSTTPQGKSILNAWPAGTALKMVFYLTTGANTNGKPVVKVGGDGKAITAYMPFTTVAKPGDSLRTSAGYTNNAFGVQPVGTSTVLTVSPPSPQTDSTPLTLTATVAQASGSAFPTGTVQFFDGATSLGSGSVNGSGVATLAGVLLPAGSHSLTAVFTGTGAFTNSTSTAVPFTTTGPPAVGTTIAVSATPGADSSYPVALSATVAAADSTCPAGSVQFKEGAVVLATVTPAGPGCVYSTSQTFGPGSHTVTAIFTPTGNYTTATNSVTFTLAPPAGVSTDPQDIKAEVPAGAILIETPYTAANPLDLGTMALTTDLSQYSATATFEDIHLLDTRAGAQPWTVTALSGALTNGGNSINGQNVGLTNLVLDNTTGAATPFVQQPGLGVVTVFNNPAASPAVAPAAPGSLGLGGTAKTIMSSTQGPSNVQYKGTLTLNAPTTTPAGVYQGTITFTAS